LGGHCPTCPINEPPLLESKAQIFNDYVILQCTTLDTGSEILNATPLHVPVLTGFQIADEKILGVIRSINSNKAHGWGYISIRMIRICDQALIIPLKINYETCIAKGVFPQIWKKLMLFWSTRNTVNTSSKIIVQYPFFPYLENYLKT